MPFRSHLACKATLLSFLLALPVVAATVPFTFTVNGGAALLGPPAPDTPVGVLLIASGNFAPFGPAEYSESGTITFTVWPSGDFAPESVSNTFVAAFNRGADTFTGTHNFVFGPPTATGQATTSTMMILGGTGIFTGATGSSTSTGTNSPPPTPDDLSPVFFTGSGEITAPGLAAIPEPSTVAIVAAGLVALWLRKRTCNVIRGRAAGY